MLPTEERELREGFFASSAPDRGLYGRRRIEFTVLGEPEGQGSAKAFARQTTDGRVFAKVTHDNPKLVEWRHRVATEAQRTLHARGDTTLFAGPVAVDILFEIPRPKSTPRRVTAITTRPDLDKCIRAIFDALTNVLWRDDSQVVEVRARKRYAEPNQPASARIAVEG